MTEKRIHDTIARQKVFEGMSDHCVDLISGCASTARFKKGEFLILSGTPAEEFFILLEGTTAVELEAANKTVQFQTIREGGLVGWSWLVPPFMSHYDIRATGPVFALRFDARCVRGKCDEDPEFGYEVYKRFNRVIVQRLMHTRMLVADVYG